jgi:hypothetical protein
VAEWADDWLMGCGSLNTAFNIEYLAKTIERDRDKEQEGDLEAYSFHVR